MNIFLAHVEEPGDRVSFYPHHLTSNYTSKSPTSDYEIVGSMMIASLCEKVMNIYLFRILYILW